ncbi:MAG: serine hydrolase [Daejeonella sp.]|uniref:serine hydrolase n=1 Tax=Daejeonella sp. TaxID=2805397 RepID=UPI002732ADAB|nr:serine hydrolase [Daejeonella sp.]MDP3468698.1 serine hydrolase [Daejeonella sp.]
MMYSLILPILLFMLPSGPKDPEELRNKIKAELSKNKGVFAMAYRNLASGEEILINEKINFHAASTMKTPVLIEAFKQANSRKFSINDSLIVKNEFKSIVDGSTYSLNPKDDSETELYTKAGKKVKIYDLLYLMIIQSSNLATNIVIDLVGAHNANKTMRELGANDIQVLRGVEDTKAFRAGLNNTTTAYDQMLIFSKMANGLAVDKSSSDAMINILLDQKFNDKIPAKLPKKVKVAHKTGWITGVNHDAGIVILPDGRKYVLVLLSKELDNDKSAVKSMARVSRMIYDYFVNKE